MPTSLLSSAIEDNIRWCSAVCAAHGSNEETSATAWINLLPSPPYYPNIITREPLAQADVIPLIEAVRKRNATSPWGIKDSFGDLDLTMRGFDLVIEGQWFGGTPTTGQKIPHHWDRAHSPEELSRWEEAWGGGSDRRIFKDSLLADPRIRFWMLHEADEIIAGCVSFTSGGPAIGLSNWFSKRAETAFDLGVTTVLARPIVCWAPATDPAPRGLSPLGPLSVWISAP